MARCFFVSDLHGNVDHYRKLFGLMVEEKPAALFLGGDFLPSGMATFIGAPAPHRDFINDFLVAEFGKLREQLADDYPRVFLIMGNDDGRLALYQSGLGESVSKSGEVVTINLNRVPAKGLPLAVEGFQIHDVTGPAVYLLVIAVYNRNQVVQLEVGGGHGGLPYLPLIALAVTEQGVDPVRLRAEATGQGYPDGKGQPLSQGAG